jgi:hypothetical protein
MSTTFDVEAGRITLERFPTGTVKMTISHEEASASVVMVQVDVLTLMEALRQTQPDAAMRSTNHEERIGAERAAFEKASKP